MILPCPPSNQAEDGSIAALKRCIVMDQQGPLAGQANHEKIDTLKRRAQEIGCDLWSQDDVQMSYLEMLEERDNDNLRLAQMLAG
jgi:hypothetical protein